MPPAATAEQREYRFAKRLAILVAAVTVAVFFSGLFYGPRPTEIELPDGLCAIAKGSFVYVGTRDERRCRWLIAAESHGWVVSELRGHWLQLRASWNAAQVKFDGQLFEIGKFHERSAGNDSRVYKRPPGA